MYIPQRVFPNFLFLAAFSIFLSFKDFIFVLRLVVTLSRLSQPCQGFLSPPSVLTLS